MERMLFFEEVVTYHHSIKLEGDSKELLEDMLEDICCSIESGEIEEKEEIQRRISNRGIKSTFIEDGSPDVEITCI